MKNILFILTGGTIDAKTTGQERDEILEISAIPEYLGALHIGQKIRFFQFCKKDSRDVNEFDRLGILSEIQTSDEEIIIVTHGTFTLVDTAKYLKQKLTGVKKVIILLGSMIPLKGFENSDAPFNLGFALGKAESLSYGVYILMNSRVFDPDEAVKDLEKNLFYSLNDKTP
jgi:L-asparaginase